MDISTYLSLAATLVLHLVDVGIHQLTDQVAVWQSRCVCRHMCTRTHTHNMHMHTHTRARTHTRSPES